MEIYVLVFFLLLILSIAYFLWQPAKPICTVSDEVRDWGINTFDWLIQEFGYNKFDEINMLTPTIKDFPIKSEDNEKLARETLNIICNQMNIDPMDVELTFYKTKFLDKNGKTTAGLYRGINENNKYHVQLNEEFIAHHEKLVAVLAHELCHVKLIGEDRDDNADDEFLTDFTTVFFGLGIFNANASKEYYHNNSGVTFSDSGYIDESEFAFILALFAYYKNDFKAEWSKYLSTTITHFFKANLHYLIKNEGTLFTEKTNEIEYVRRYKEVKGLRFLD
jgi:hypothetical protein